MTCVATGIPIIQPRLHDCAVAAQVTLKTEGPRGVQVRHRPAEVDPQWRRSRSQHVRRPGAAVLAVARRCAAAASHRRSNVHGGRIVRQARMRAGYSGYSHGMIWAHMGYSGYTWGTLGTSTHIWVLWYAWGTLGTHGYSGYPCGPKYSHVREDPAHENEDRDQATLKNLTAP